MVAFGVPILKILIGQTKNAVAKLKWVAPMSFPFPRTMYQTGPSGRQSESDLRNVTLTAGSIEQWGLGNGIAVAGAMAVDFVRRVAGGCSRF